MAILGRSLDDIIIDEMVDALQAFSDEQADIDPAVKFYVERDRVRMPTKKILPFVNIWLDSLEPEQEKSSGRLYLSERAIINIDCYATGSDTTSDGLYNNKASLRLYYLKEQVRTALFALINSDFNQEIGTISGKSWPNWRLFQDDLKLPEQEVIAGRWTMEIRYAWEPLDDNNIALDKIVVDAGKWQGEYNF